jgi:hypothetical protein
VFQYAPSGSTSVPTSASESAPTFSESYPQPPGSVKHGAVSPIGV